MIETDKVRVLAAAPDGKVHEKLVSKKPVGDNEVGIRVTHSGVCATDLHYLHQDMVLGHEGLIPKFWQWNKAENLHRSRYH